MAVLWLFVYILKTTQYPLKKITYWRKPEILLMSPRLKHQAALYSLVHAALQSPGLLPPNEFNLARYSLDPLVRNRLLDPDICALEDYLIDKCRIENPGDDADMDLLHTFGDVVYDVCNDVKTSLQIGYQHMGWLLAWLNAHHQPQFFEAEPDSPLQVLQLATSPGIGEWASAHNQIEEGMEQLLEMANSNLWRVRNASSLGLERMLMRRWDRTIRRYRYQAMIANASEWRAIIASWSHIAEDLLLDQPERILDVFELLQAALRFIMQRESDRKAEKRNQLIECLNSAIAVVVRIAPASGFAQMGYWALWDHKDVRAIIRANLIHLQDWSEEIAQIERQLAQ